MTSINLSRDDQDLRGRRIVSQEETELTHWGRDEVNNISQTTFSKRIFFNENVWISIKISLKFVPKGSINNIPALAQIMAWRRSGNKPLSEPMMVSLPTHICVTRSQWVNIQCISITRPNNVWYIVDHKLSGAPLIPAWLSNYIHCRVWDEITYPFPNFNGATIPHSSLYGHRWIHRTKASDAELWCFHSLICAWINGWASNREAGDLRRHRAH